MEPVQTSSKNLKQESLPLTILGPPKVNQKVIVTAFGGTDKLKLVEEELQSPGPAEVRIKILAAGVSFADLLLRVGMHPEVEKPPFTLGWDIIGEVVETGEKVTKFKPGDRVAALPIKGGYAKYITLNEEELVLVPNGLTTEEAVCLVMNYIVAFQMFYRLAKVKDDNTILIHSATGGVGSALFQIARLHKVKIYGTVSTENVEIFRSQGGIPIDYRSEDFVKVSAEQEPEGFDAVFDGIGGEHVRQSYKTLASNGRLVFYGFTSFLVHPKKRWIMLFKTLWILKTFWNFLSLYAANLIPNYKRLKVYSIQQLKRKHEIWFKEDLTRLFQLLKEEKIKPVVHSTISLDEVAEAHEHLHKGGVVGKIIIVNE